MSTTMQLSDLRLAIRQRADMVNSSGVYTNSAITDPELNSYINQSIFELYDLIVQKYGDNYYIQTPYTFVTDGTNQLFSLPSDFYKGIGVDLALSASLNSWVTLKTFAFAERNKYAAPNLPSMYGRTNLRYRLNGSQILFNQIPSGGQTMRLWYVPKFTTLSADTDTFDGISGWTEYVIIDAAIKCMQKEESDVSVLMSQKQAIIKRIESAAENREASGSMCVADTQGSEGLWPDGWSGGNY